MPFAAILDGRQQVSAPARTWKEGGRSAANVDVLFEYPAFKNILFEYPAAAAGLLQGVSAPAVPHHPRGVPGRVLRTPIHAGGFHAAGVVSARNMPFR